MLLNLGRDMCNVPTPNTGISYFIVMQFPMWTGAATCGEDLKLPDYPIYDVAILHLPFYPTCW